MSEFGRYGSRSPMPEGVLHLLIINFLVYLLAIRFGDFMNKQLAGYFIANTESFRPWQVITHMFMHARGQGGGLIAQNAHILFNMFMLWMFGRVLANIWDTKRFLFFYFTCGLGAFVAHELYIAVDHYFLGNERAFFSSFVGASGAIYGMLVAYAYLFPNSKIYLYFLIPIKAKYLISIVILADLFYGLRNAASDNVARFAHLGGALAGFILIRYWQKNKKTFY